MIKVIVNQQPLYDEFIPEEDTSNYSINAEFEASEDSTATEVLSMFCKAMKLEGYLEKSIIKAMYNIIMYNEDTPQEEE